MLERDSQLRELSALARVLGRSAAGRVVLIRGEAGVGKTAVIDLFASDAGRGTRVLRGWCDPVTAPQPPKTVSHHVEAILTRLEVDNRVQAARELNRDATPS